MQVLLRCSINHHDMIIMERNKWKSVRRLVAGPQHSYCISVQSEPHGETDRRAGNIEERKDPHF